MSGRNAESKQFYIAGTVWNIWADYWIAIGELIPPLHYMRLGGGEDFIFVSAVGHKDLDSFLHAVKRTPDLKFVKQGDWWLPTVHWFGHWSVFSAGVRQTYVGFERRVWGYGEVIDFDRTGDSRMTQLRSPDNPNSEAV